MLKRGSSKSKRVLLKPKMARTDSDTRSAFSLDILSLLRFCVLLSVIVALTGFLLYPDIVKAVDSVKERRRDGGATEPEQCFDDSCDKGSVEAEKVKDRASKYKKKAKVDQPEDLMEGEVEEGLENADGTRSAGEPGKKKGKSTEKKKTGEKKNIQNEKNDKNRKEKKNAEESKKDTGNSKKSTKEGVKNKKSKPDIPDRPGRKKDDPKPIVLDGSQNTITLDPSQIRFVDEEPDKDKKKTPPSKDGAKKSPSKQKKPSQDKKEQDAKKKKKTGDGDNQTKKSKTGKVKKKQKEEIVLEPDENVIVFDSDDQDANSPNSKPAVKKQNKAPSKSTKKDTVKGSKPKSKEKIKEMDEKLVKTTEKENPRDETKEDQDNKTTVEKSNEGEKEKKFKATYQKTFTPKKVFIDGRRIPPTELLHQKESDSSVKVYLFNEFLSERECDGLVKSHKSHIKDMDDSPIICFDSLETLRQHLKDAGQDIKVTEKDFERRTLCLNESFSEDMEGFLKSNWSYSTAFYTEESKFAPVLANRIQQAMGLNPENGGKYQVTSYPLHSAYKAHTDCTLGSDNKRDRVATVLIYLNDAEDGGETDFPDLGIWVKPKKGRALVWNNMSPGGYCEPHSRHQAKVVKAGSKYILIRWYYYKSFKTLGTRPDPPKLPSREEKQPMVMCDEYSNGSCRWYDEWSHDVMVDYRKNVN